MRYPLHSASTNFKQNLMSSPSSLLAEHQSPTQIHGSYRRLAGLVGRLPELTVFCKFSELNALYLPSLQSELARLGSEFRELCTENAESECPVTRTYQCNFREIGSAEGKGGGLQKDLLKVIGTKF